MPLRPGEDVACHQKAILKCQQEKSDNVQEAVVEPWGEVLLLEREAHGKDGARKGDQEKGQLQQVIVPHPGESL